MAGLNPVEWCAWLYGKLFVNHPGWGYVVAGTVGCVLACVFWSMGVERYKKEHPVQIEKSSTEQLADIEIKQHREREFDDKVRTALTDLIPSAVGQTVHPLALKALITDEVVRQLSLKVNASETDVRQSIERLRSQDRLPFKIG